MTRCTPLVVSFRFRDTVEPSSAVLSLVASLQLHPPQHALSAAFKFETFSPTEIKLLSFLTPQRCGIIHVSHDHESSCTMREPWYGTAFTVSPIDEKLLQRCESATVHEKLHWPELNPFIPTDFALVCDTPGFKASIAGGGNGVRSGRLTSTTASAATNPASTRLLVSAGICAIRIMICARRSTIS